MRRLLLAGSAAIAALIAPVAISAQTASADTTVQAGGRTYVLTADQKAVFDGWTADQRAAYNTWPYDGQTYYWTLTPEGTTQWWALNDSQRTSLLGWPLDRRSAYFTWPEGARSYFWTLPADDQAAFWTLTPEQQLSIYTLPADQQAAMWASLRQPAVSAEVAGPATAGQVTIVDNRVPPPPASAMNKSYPICTKTLQDSCRNPGGK